MMSVEIYSTAYMLRLLSTSVIGDTVNYKILFMIKQDNISKLTGKWENDSQYFDIKTTDSNSNETGRLIMGFGPSASGKTYCAKQIIDLMAIVDTTFPKFFLTIDGGIYREQSHIYQKIVKICQENQIAGLSNLVSASVLTTLKTLFDSNIIKKNMKKYLLSQKNKNQKINLYVPDTITACIGSASCKSLYQDYIDITGDKKGWVGLVIYQHKSGKECPYPEQYKCVGCEESGKSREIKEGKKYSSTAWSNSYRNGNDSILQAPNYRFRIHNSGGKNDGKNITIFEDLSVKPIISDKTSEFLKRLKWKYSQGKVKNDKTFFETSNLAPISSAPIQVST
jgi:hypothetical protein